MLRKKLAENLNKILCHFWDLRDIFYFHYMEINFVPLKIICSQKKTHEIHILKHVGDKLQITGQNPFPIGGNRFCPVFFNKKYAARKNTQKSRFKASQSQPDFLRKITSYY